MALATTLGSPIATAATKKKRAPVAHAAASAYPCHCDMAPYHGAPKHGGWLNTALPGDKKTITNARRVRSLSGGNLFLIDKKTPMLGGNGTGEVRGWVVGTVRAKEGTETRISYRHKVQINWGQQKYMPPPNLGGPVPPSGKRVLYYYAFSVTLQRTPHPAPATGLPPPEYPPAGERLGGVGASGWIPASCLVLKGANKKKLAALMKCCGTCMSRLDKLPRRRRFTRSLPSKPTHTIVATKKEISEKFEHRYYTRVHQGNGAHYLSRSEDRVSPAGYVNLCYNLPDLTEGSTNVGGVSCDTLTVGTFFHRIVKAGFVDVKLCNFRNEYKYKQRFVYGAVPYIESTKPLKIKYRYGWIAKRSIRALP